MLSLSSKKSTKSKEANADIEDPAVAEEKWDKRNKQQSRVPYFYSPPQKDTCAENEEVKGVYVSLETIKMNKVF